MTGAASAEVLRDSARCRAGPPAAAGRPGLLRRRRRDTPLGQVEAAGDTVLAPPNDMPWGQRVAHLADPDGNLINLTHRI
ncbi:VOC family protein [Micromonospora sp. Llam0]|uniref:VOC family protein n=1 Tax=Micromonospora sp. Llam0 TaxID=2485143 RepID=UPI00351A2E4F